MEEIPTFKPELPKNPIRERVSSSAYGKVCNIVVGVAVGVAVGIYPFDDSTSSCMFQVTPKKVERTKEPDPEITFAPNLVPSKLREQVAIDMHSVSFMTALGFYPL